MAKRGKKMSQEQRDELPQNKVVNQIMQFVRADYGGKDPLVANIEAAKEFCESKGKKLSDEGYELMALFGLIRTERCRAGIAKRIETPVGEIRRRCALVELVQDDLAAGNIAASKIMLEKATRKGTKSAAVLF